MTDCFPDRKKSCQGQKIANLYGYRQDEFDGWLEIRQSGCGLNCIVLQFATMTTTPPAPAFSDTSTPVRMGIRSHKDFAAASWRAGISRLSR